MQARQVVLRRLHRLIHSAAKPQACAQHKPAVKVAHREHSTSSTPIKRPAAFAQRVVFRGQSAKQPRLIRLTPTPDTCACKRLRTGWHLLIICRLLGDPAFVRRCIKAGLGASYMRWKVALPVSFSQRDLQFTQCEVCGSSCKRANPMSSPHSSHRPYVPVDMRSKAT